MRAPAKQSLVHISEKQLDVARISIMEYDESRWTQRELTQEQMATLDKLEVGGGVVWINVDGVHEQKTLDALGQRFGIHPLVISEINDQQHRPRLEELDDSIFIVLKMLFVDGDAEQIYVEQMSLMIGKSWVITFQKRQGDVFDDVRNKIKNATGRIRKQGADYLAYRLVDAIVDNYFVALDEMGDLIESVETQMTDDPRRVNANDLHTLKRESLFLRKVVVPARELIATLCKIEDPELIRPSTLVYLRDVYDHIVQVSETLEVQRGILASMTDVYHASISNRMNEVMKVMTIVSTIFIPLSFIAGLYGMNFDNMPELHVWWAYYAIVALMALAAAGMLVYFKRKGWF